MTRQFVAALTFVLALLAFIVLIHLDEWQQERKNQSTNQPKGTDHEHDL